MVNHLKVLIAEDCVEFNQNNSNVFDAVQLYDDL